MQLVDYEKLCDAILRLDDKIRFVGVYLNSRYYKKMRENTTSYLSEEQTEESLKQALDRWNGRKKFSEEMGLPLYSVTRYQKEHQLHGRPSRQRQSSGHKGHHQAGGWQWRHPNPRTAGGRLSGKPGLLPDGPGDPNTAHRTGWQ